MNTKQQHGFHNNIIDILNQIEGVEIQNSKSFNLKNYKNISFAEIIISFLKSDVKCPQGYLFKKNNSEDEITKYTLGISNLYDLRVKLQIETRKFDYFALSKDIFLRRVNNNGLDDRVIINCSEPILIGYEENDLESLIELKKKIDLSSTDISNIPREEIKRCTRLYAYLNNDIKREYSPFSNN